VGPRASLNNFGEERSFTPTGIGTPARPARSIVTLPTMKYFLNVTCSPVVQGMDCDISGMFTSNTERGYTQVLQLMF
jgi:hypothetical protein